MNYGKLITTLELILAKSNAHTEDVIVSLYAIKRQRPLPLRRYEQILEDALADESAHWVAGERIQLLLCWAEISDEADKGSHNVRLTDADWNYARSIGQGNASRGIRMALRRAASPSQLGRPQKSVLRES